MTDDTEAARAETEEQRLERLLDKATKLWPELRECDWPMTRLAVAFAEVEDAARAEGARAGEADGLMKAATRLRDHVGGVLGNRYHPLACEWEAEAAAIRARFPKERQGA